MSLHISSNFDTAFPRGADYTPLLVPEPGVFDIRRFVSSVIVLVQLARNAADFIAGRDFDSSNGPDRPYESDA